MDEGYRGRGDGDVMPSERGLKHQTQKKEKCNGFLTILWEKLKIFFKIPFVFV